MMKTILGSCLTVAVNTGFATAEPLIPNGKTPFAPSAVLASAVGIKTNPKTIDAVLLNQLDFREVVFKTCYGQSSCIADNLVVSALRLNAESGEWTPAQLYWDPIDGFGVLGGGQDDEIDVDEKIVVTFSSPVRIANVWYSDLFAKEQERYGQATLQNASLDNDGGALQFDYEKARATIYTPAGIAEQTVTFGLVDLPAIEFNEIINDDIFSTGGDLRKRLLIDDGTVSILSGHVDDTGAISTTTARLGDISNEKALILQGLGLEKTDLAATVGFSESVDIALFDGETINNKRLTAFLSNLDQLQTISNAAQLERAVGDVSNGEVPQRFSQDHSVQSIEFTAEADTSNDYSIAGFVFVNN